MAWTRRFLLKTGGLTALAGCAGSASDPAGDSDSSAPEAPRGAHALSKPPWVHHTGAGEAVLRFETREVGDIPVTLSDGDRTWDAVPTQREDELTFNRPTGQREDLLPDEPGLHVLHEVKIEGVAPGSVVAWRVYAEDTVHEGAFRVPDPSAGFRIGWLSDTMWPNTDATVEKLAAEAPDVVLHGGDIEYEDNPFDTWNGFFRSMVPLTSQAAIHLAVGNHEFEFGGEEIEQMYERMFGGQGDSGTNRYHAFTMGRLRIICLDSETTRIGDPDSPQHAWLGEQLAAADADANLAGSLIYFHRPVFSLSKHFPGSTAARDALHELVTSHKVNLVMVGHAHAFEHFLVDGVHYVVDGGAGALLYDPDERMARAAEERPEDIERRQFATRTYGASVIDVAADGSMRFRRIAAEDGSEQYAFDIEAPTLE